MWLCSGIISRSHLRALISRKSVSLKISYIIPKDVTRWTTLSVVGQHGLLSLTNKTTFSLNKAIMFVMSSMSVSSSVGERVSVYFTTRASWPKQNIKHTVRSGGCWQTGMVVGWLDGELYAVNLHKAVVSRIFSFKPKRQMLFCSPQKSSKTTKDVSEDELFALLLLLLLLDWSWRDR